MSWDLKSKEDTFVGCDLGICTISVVLDRSASLLELVLILQMEGHCSAGGVGSVMRLHHSSGAPDAQVMGRARTRGLEPWQELKKNIV